MGELKEVLSELIDKTKSGALQWKAANSDKSGWNVRHHDCMFTVHAPDFHLDLAWHYSGEWTGKELGRGAEIKPLTDLLQEMYPFITPTKPTTDNALQAALACLTK